MHRCTISHIDPDSPLRHAAHPGDRLVSINGNPITDVLDYKYYAYDPELAVRLRRPDGTEHTVHVSKPLGGELGLDFETYLMDNAHSCANHCVFCFIDQMPPGMRPTLYFKDDDARLSFLMGNYMTLTNLSEREVQRIIHLHISPINVSVHATDPELRSFLLGNPRAGKTLEIMRRFSDGGITMNCQIVCCPGLNDGAQLQRTMHDLAALYPKVHSVSIVPVGLTKFREGLYPLTPFTPEHAAETLDLVNAFGDECDQIRRARLLLRRRAVSESGARAAAGGILRGIHPAGKRRRHAAAAADGVSLGAEPVRSAGRRAVFHGGGCFGSAVSGKTFVYGAGKVCYNKRTRLRDRK